MIDVPSRLKGQVIVSCQASPNDPLDNVDTLQRIATAVIRGGAGGLRADGPECICAFRAITDLPIIGISKKYDAQGNVCITPDFASALAIAHAGADVIALDCTAQRLKANEPWPGLIQRIHRELNRPVLADIATIDEAVAATDAGADAVATTLFGYTLETANCRFVSWDLIEGIVERVNVPLIVEGHITRPEEVRRAFDMGAFAVVIGSAITRPEAITARFVQAIHP